MVHIYVLSEPQNHRCCYCGHLIEQHAHKDGIPTPRNAATRDHYEPKTYGGTMRRENMIAACCQCNNLRGEMDAHAFYNLMQKWFKRDSALHERWHRISREELAALKIQCIRVHERQLCGLAKRYVEMAFRHFDLLRKYPHHLRA